MTDNLICDDEDNELCPKCGTIMIGHGCSGWSEIRGIPVEQECSWLECPKCRFIIND
jgi:hypothetical protein